MLHGYKRILIEVPFPLNARETQYSEALLQATHAAKRSRFSRPRAWFVFMATGVTAQARTEKLLIHGENHGFKTMEMVGASSIVCADRLSRFWVVRGFFSRSQR